LKITWGRSFLINCDQFEYHITCYRDKNSLSRKMKNWQASKSWPFSQNQCFKLNFNDFQFEKWKLDVFIFDIKLRMLTIFKSSIVYSYFKMPTIGNPADYWHIDINRNSAYILKTEKIKKTQTIVFPVISYFWYLTAQMSFFFKWMKNVCTKSKVKLF
jgi:hypothetical protein